MNKKEMNEFWKKTEKQLKGIGAKVVVVAKDLKKDAVYGAKASRAGIEKMNMEGKRRKLFVDLGKEVYKLHQKNNIKAPGIDKICKKIAEINKGIAGKERYSSKLKSELIKEVKTSEKAPAKKTVSKKKK